MGFDTKPDLTDNKFEQFSGQTLSLSGDTDIYGELEIKSGAYFKMTSGATAGKVMTSDTLGIASWGDAYTSPICGYTCAANDSTYIANNVTSYSSISGGTNNIAIGCVALCSVSGASRNIGIGAFSQCGNTSGDNNISLGYDSSRSLVSGHCNISMGYQALYSNTAGSFNISLGMCSSFKLDGGGNNIALGQYTLCAATGGSNQVAIGPYAMRDATCGYSNVAIGTNALRFNTTGQYNIALGDTALYNNTTGRLNVAQGFYALNANETGCNNVGIGSTTLAANVSGCDNIALGRESMYSAIGGSYNIALGFRSLHKNTTGLCNIAIGIQSLYCNETGRNNVALGTSPLICNETGWNNVAVGIYTLYNNISANNNVAVGNQGLYSNTGGTENIALGYQPLRANTSGCYNIALSSSALFSNTTGSNNIVLGQCALYSNTTGVGNIALGQATLFSNTGGSYNIVLGGINVASDNTVGNFNIAMGGYVLTENTSGCYNIAMGVGTMCNSLSGCENVAFGRETLRYTCTGCYNVALGSYAFNQNRIGCSTVAIGHAAGNSVTGSSCSVFIGKSAGLGETENERLHIGNNQNCSLIYGEFDNKYLEIDGCLAITESPTRDTQTNILYIGDNGLIYTGATSGVTSGITTGGSGENVTKEITQSSHGFAVKDFIGWSGGTYNKAIADGTYDGEFVGLVSEVPDVDTFCLTQSGYISGLTGLVTNTTYWLSPDTAGLITDTEPSIDGEVSKAVLVANSTTSAWVLPYAGFMVASGATVLSTADNGLTDNSGIVELGGTLCRDTDIDVDGFNLSISGLSGKTTQEKAIFVDDVTGTLVTGATTQTYQGQSPSAIEVGGIGIGTNISGCTFTQLWEDLLVPELYQTSVGTPSTSVGATLTGLREIGCSFSQTITPSYSAGAITPLYCTDNGTTRGGAANNYSYSGSGVTTGFLGCTSCVINPYVVTIGTNLWTVCTRYDEGACIKGSKGTVNPSYPTVCAQDSCTPTGSVSVIGAYPLWATCDNITTPLEKFSPLCDMATANNICMVLVDETASDKQKFEIPCAWLGSPTSRPLTGVCLWNSVGGSWEYQGGSAANSLTYWTCSSATETVQSNSVGYCQFTYNGPQRGTVCIRLVF